MFLFEIFIDAIDDHDLDDGADAVPLAPGGVCLSTLSPPPNPAIVACPSIHTRVPGTDLFVFFVKRLKSANYC